MKRSDFLKRLGIGLGAVVVAPKVLASMPAKEEDIPDDIKEEITEAFNNAPWKRVNNDYLKGEYYVGLFFENKELSYGGYKRQKTRCRLSLNGDGNWTLIPDDVIFKAIPEPKYCNLIKIFDHKGDVLYHVAYGYNLYLSDSGNNIISWPKQC